MKDSTHRRISLTFIFVSLIGLVLAIKDNNVINAILHTGSIILNALNYEFHR